MIMNNFFWNTSWGDNYQKRLLDYFTIMFVFMAMKLQNTEYIRETQLDNAYAESTRALLPLKRLITSF